jgi:hypothetical protein
VTITIILPCSRFSICKQQDLVAGGAVEVAGRLVANEERRVGDNSSRDGHALLLAARQLLRLVAAAVREPDQREGWWRAAAVRRGRSVRRAAPTFRWADSRSRL